LSVLGPEGLLRHLDTLSQVSRASTLTISPDLWGRNMSFLYHNFFFVVGLPALIYALILSLRREPRSLRLLFPTLLILGFLAWFLFLSIGWPRYAYPVLALAQAWVAKPLMDLLGGLPRGLTRLRAEVGQARLALPLTSAVVAFLMGAYPLQDIVRQVFSASDPAPLQFAAYVEAHTPSEAMIESLDWQPIFLADRRFHTPPADVFARLLNGLGPGSYDPLALQPDYLIDGPYSKSSRLYTEAWLGECCHKLASFGDFDLYEVVFTE
jgi:hypothetical protein